MDKSVTILLGFYSKFEAAVSSGMKRYGYVPQVHSFGKISQIAEYMKKWPVDAVIMRPVNEKELRECASLRDMGAPIIILLSKELNEPEPKRAMLDAGFYDAIYIGKEKSMVSQIVRLMTEGRTIREAEVYYGFETAQVPENFEDHYDVNDEQDMKMLYEFLLDRVDNRTIVQRYNRIMEIIPKEAREDFTKSLPGQVQRMSLSIPR